MRPKLLPLIVVPIALVLVGCGPSKPGPTVYVTVPVTKPADPTRPITTQPAKPNEPAAPIDPWKEAKAYFEKVKETEKEKTEAKLKKMDKQAERIFRAYTERLREYGSLDVGSPTQGQQLWSAGFTEAVESKADWPLKDQRFRDAFKKLNPDPTAEEVINAAIRFAITELSIRRLTLDLIEKGGDTRDSPETHRAATAWTGK